MNSRYQARINKVSFYTLIVRVDADGQENVIRGFKPRHYATLARAEKATTDYISKNHAA